MKYWFNRNMKKITLLLGLGMITLPFIAKHEFFQTKSMVIEQRIHCQLCFVPGNDCTTKIIKQIANAKKEILIQAYSFTSLPIADALIDAHKRGVKVRCIIDKSQKDKTLPLKLSIFNIDVYIDFPPGIAHCKVMIIDDARVITGSFNFTNAAQHRNVENVLFIENAEIAKEYKNNWHSRLLVSKEFKSYDGK